MARRPSNRNRPDDTLRPDFEFCVLGRPVSAQAQNRLLLHEWKAVVRAAAQAAWAGTRTRFAGDVELRMTHYSERRIADRDNFLKPIQDALQGVVYEDDGQIRDSTSNWRNINGRLTIRNLSLPLAVTFSNGSEFLHVRVWISPDIEDLG